MYAEISAALTSIKSLIEIAKLTNDAKISSQVLQKTAELNATILTLQEKMMALHSDKDRLLQEKKELEQKIVQFEKWETEAGRYELKEIASGVFVYAVKPGGTLAEPAHWLCAHCYSNKCRSILQRGAITFEGTAYHCPNCKSEIIDHSKRISISPSAIAGGRRGPDFI